MSTVPHPVIPPLPTRVAGVERPVTCLNDRSTLGAWEFLFQPVNNAPGIDASNQDLPDGALPSAGWQHVAVPGELAMQGFDVGNNIEYYYRRELSVPADAAGHRALLRFDGVYSNARVWVDGHHVGSHVGGFTTWYCDITDWVQAGTAVDLVVGVADLEGDEPGICNPKGRILGDPSWASYYAHHNICGILRDVSLVILPVVHLASLHVDTTFTDEYQTACVSVRGELANAPEATENAAVLLSLFNAEGIEIAAATACPDGTAWQATLAVNQPHLWDAEHPYLYRLEVAVVVDGACPCDGNTPLADVPAVEIVRRRIGLREITYGGADGTDRNKIYINGKPIKLRGVCRHDVSDRFGRSTTCEEDWAEIRTYRDANINHIRTSHYPPSRHLLEACDELGMYVEEETSACFQGTGGKDIHANPADFMGAFTEMIERDCDHPSVIIWSLGNESAFDRTLAFRQEYDHVKTCDASRPVIFSYPFEVESAPLPYDIISRHYESVDGPLGSASLPVLHDEFAHVPCYNNAELKRDPNVRSFWGHGLRAAWKNVFDEDGALGCDLWSAVDDVFPLPEGVDGRWQRHARGVWPGYGPWGAIFDCHKRLKPEAFLVKKAFSPICIDENIWYRIGDQIVVPIRNRFDHTRLSELALSCIVDGAPHADVQLPDLAPHADGLLTLSGIDEGASCTELRWELGGREIDSFVLDLAGEHRDQPTRTSMPRAGLPDRRPELVITASEIQVTTGPVCYRFSRRNSLLIAAEYEGRAVITGGPKLHLTGAELFRPWSATRTPYAAYEDDHVIVILQGGYGTRVPLQFICRIYGDGRMTVEYQTRVTNINAASLSEWGLSFELPDDVARVRWERDAPYARYPERHIARPKGVAERIYRPALEAGYRALPDWPWEQDMYDAYLAEPGEGAWRAATNDFKAMREHIRSYAVEFESGEACVEALSIGDTAARVELAGAHPSLVINQQWWYPQIAWGNDCGRPVQLVEGTGRGEVCLRIRRA